MAEKLHNDLDAAIAYVDSAQSQLELGNIVILQELQDNVAKICETIANMPVDEGRIYREQIIELSDKMQSLEIDLRTKKIEVERELKATNKSQTAATAYAKASVSSNSNKDDE